MRVENLTVGDVRLSDAEAHHLRDVLRLEIGDVVELFDDAGKVAPATLHTCDPQSVVARVERLDAPGAERTLSVVVASAVPKANRADWMIEKLAELGVDEFVPLATARGVVLPEGKNKLDRWRRLSIEASKQSHRRGVMQVRKLTKLSVALDDAQRDAQPAWCLASESHVRARSIVEAARDLNLVETSTPARLTVFIGPEGGWTPEELNLFVARGVTAVRLTNTILRIETAALTVAGFALCCANFSPGCVNVEDPVKQKNFLSDDKT